MSLSAGRDLLPLAYSCPSGKSRSHRNESSDEQANTAPANKGKAFLMSPRRRRELEIDELEAELRAETLAKVDEAGETRVQVDNTEALVTADEADDARTQVDVVNKSYDEREITKDTSKNRETEEVTTENLDIVNGKGQDELLEEGQIRELREQDEERETTDTSIIEEKQEEEGIDEIEEFCEKKEGDATEIIEESDEHEEGRCVEDELHTQFDSMSYLPTLLSNIFDDDGYLHCCSYGRS